MSSFGFKQGGGGRARLPDGLECPVQPGEAGADGQCRGRSEVHSGGGRLREALDFFLLFYGILPKGGKVLADPKVFSHFFLP